AQDVPPEVLDKAYEDLADFSALFQVEAFTLFSHSGATRWQPRRDFRLGGAS
ncbi:2'-5' RNA ligase family protein, partial [Micromonospora chalcea]